MNFNSIQNLLVGLLKKAQPKALVITTLTFACFIATPTTSFTQDYSRSYSYGGTLRAPQQPQAGTRDIINVNGSFEAGGVLGCDGLDLSSLVDSQLGGIGNIGDLSKDIANAAKTRMFNEALTRLFSDPQVASVLDNIQGMAQARIGLLQKECDANQIMADATNARLRAAATQRCLANEPTGMEACGDPDTLANYLGEEVSSPKWNDDLQTQLCDTETDENCDWRLLVPNKRIDLRGDDSTEADDDDDADSEDDDTAETDDDAITPAEPGEEVPAAIDMADVVSIARSTAAEILMSRIEDAESLRNIIGYAATMREALHTGPGFSAETQQILADLRRESDSAEERREILEVSSIYNLYEFNNNQSCSFSTFEAGMQGDLTDILNSPPGSGIGPVDTAAAPTTGDGGGDTPPSPPEDEPEDEPDPAADAAAASGNPVFPIQGATVRNARITSTYGPRSRPCRGCSSFHRGLDLGYGTGTPLLSVMPGVVSQAGRKSCGGNQLGIQNNNIQVLYLHMNRFAPGIAPGVPVRAGAVVGEVGNTGRCTTGPHLHFVVYRNGSTIDPLPWLGGNDDVLSTALGQGGGHGTTNLAVQRASSLPADHPFVIELHKEMVKLGSRIVNTASCVINKSLHPHVFVKASLLPGKTGLVDPNDNVNTSEDDIEGTEFASGAKLAFVSGFANMVGYDSAVSVYTSTIQAMALALARQSVDGSEGMNKPLMDYAKGQLAVLKMRRANLVAEFESSCRFTRRLAHISTSIDQATQVNNALLSRGSAATDPTNSRITLASSATFNCDKYNFLRGDDGVEDIRNLLVAPSNSPSPEVPAE